MFETRNILLLLLLAMAVAVSSDKAPGKRIHPQASGTRKKPSNTGEPHEKVLLHQLKGRPLLIHGGKNTLLTRASLGPKASWRDSSLKNSSKFYGERILLDYQQYIVRTENPVRRGLLQELREMEGVDAIRYVPYDTFIVTASQKGLQQLMSTHGISGIFYLPDVFKLEPEIRFSLFEDVNYGRGMAGFKGRKLMADETENEGDQSVYVILAISDAEWSYQTVQLVSDWEQEMQDLNLGVTLKTVSKRKLLVKTKQENMKTVCQFLAHKPLVRWIEKKREVFLRNRYAVQALQSEGANMTSIWNRGINGSSQIIGIADTGIDYDHCFFNDPFETVAKCTGKIVTYRKFSSTDYQDYYGGHGTHVAGSVAGNAYDADPTEMNYAGAYNGMAPGAKIAFDDVGDSKGALPGIPDDLNTGLFPHSYHAGARLHSNSWGAKFAGYESMAMEIDEFTHDHDDFLVLVAAGNDGPHPYSIGTPATAKNILAVGATDNSLKASQVWGYSVATQVLVNQSVLDLSLLPANFGPQSADHVTGQLRLASPADACSPLDGDFAGSLLLIKRGSCSFLHKALMAQTAGARAVLIQNSEDTPVLMTSDNSSSVSIPVFSISFSDGNRLLSSLNSNIELRGTTPTTRAHSHEHLVYFSSWGPTYDFRIKPDVLCPGYRIHSSFSDGDPTSFQCGAYANSAGGALLEMSGTSMATPLCAGSAALVRDYFKGGHHAGGDASKGFNASAALVKATMIHSAQPAMVQSASGAWEFPSSVPNIQTGYGRIDLSKGLSFSDSPTRSIYRDREQVDNGGELSVCLHASSSMPFKATLVWTDPAGEYLAERVLVNDLDLIVQNKDGDVWRGNNLRQSDETYKDYVVSDNLQNAEQVSFSVSSPGLLVVRVVGVDVPLGPQAFSLVLSGSDLVEQQSSACSSITCPKNCSGHGTCLSNSVCHCDFEYGGSDCSRKFRTLEQGENHLAVTANGMSFYTFNLSHGKSFRIICTGLGPSTGSDPDYYLSYESLPTIGEYVDAVKDEGDSASFVRNQEQGGMWVLGLYARCCEDVEVLVVLEIQPGPFPSLQLSPCSFPCDCQRFTQSAGQMEDGSGVYTYNNNANCRWIISPQGGTHGALKLTFPSFDLEANYDFLQLNHCFDELCSSTSSLATLTGTVSSSASFVASSGIVEILFTSDSLVTAGGFLLKWMSLGAFDICNSQCNCGIFNGTHGVLTDGAGAGGLYPNDAFCHWILSAPQASWLQLSFKRFATELNYDLLLAKECDDAACRSSRTIGIFSGHIQNLVLLSTTGIMDIVFTSDASLQDSGFEAAWTTSLLAEEGYSPSPSLPGPCPSGYRCQECTSPCHCQQFLRQEGLVTDGSGNRGLYENFANCHWLLSPFNAANISIKFNFFETEPGYDFLCLFTCSDPSCLDRTALRNFSGYWTGEELTVNAPVLELVFLTDSTVRFPGFELSYRAIVDPRSSSVFACPPRFRNCSFTRDWPEVTPEIRSGRAATGGLGHMIVVNLYEAWLCILDHPCSEVKPDGSTDPFCFIYNEQLLRFEPWNLNSVINMY
ncbi:hypothetical protein GUITHDRAFT_112852 [Guillardia theta CCMP2712]|uniref:CUB domain-containing protein n=1 Tax=Guillardia theta (strain CCMP2712) TaxID=905079 RepID=L1IYY6_GUITC|nr:hypothetical protein GUITHDRAFT_112852 [Guillardia theta CCMP2712]EKX41119.1 hypothetical protein GUITHDRAFT_112852 [Guillardia theta CCMP2712]|eukprot:XP_005828099.1 hypothetical protein GUITHDRAFT_112852 [Guillardia theta CCMP2712]